MSATVVDPTRLDEAAATYFASDGYLYLGLGRLWCERHGSHFRPIVHDDTPAYACIYGHEADAVRADEALVNAFWEETNPRLRAFQVRVGMPENVRLLLVDCGVIAALDCLTSDELVITSIAIEHPIL